MGEEMASAVRRGRQANPAVPLVPGPPRGEEMRTWHKSLIGVGLGVVLGPAVLSIPVTPTLAQPPSHAEVNSTALGRVPCASFEFGERDAELS
jgi:hypothetical protein